MRQQMIQQLGASGRDLSSLNVSSGGYKHKRSVELPLYDSVSMKGKIVEIGRENTSVVMQDLPVYDPIKMKGSLVATMIDRDTNYSESSDPFVEAFAL